MTPAKLRGLVDGVGLARVADDLMRLAQPCVSVRTRRVDEETLPVGVSKVGGLPDLPPDVPWPEVAGQPARFLAQLSLRHVRPHDGADMLPPAGLLLFFLGLEECEFQGLVLHLLEDAASLQRMSPPLPPTASDKPFGLRAGLSLLLRSLSWLSSPSEPDFVCYSACRVELVPTLSLPNARSVFMEQVRLTEQEEESYAQLRRALAKYQKDCSHQLLGYPEQVQGDVQLEAADQEYQGNRHNDFNLDEMTERAVQWPLLMQFDMDDEAGMDWGEGSICFCIERAALQNREFQAVRVVYQFT